MKQRSTFILLIVLILSLLGANQPTPATYAKQVSQGEEAIATASRSSSEMEAVQRYAQQTGQKVSALRQDYYWTAGNAFQPRNSAVTLGYNGGGCTYRASSAGLTSDDDALTADVQLPTGSIILGVQFFGYDINASANSDLLLTAYDGVGGFNNLASGSIVGEPGYTSIYMTLSTPYTVTNSDESLSLVWYSNDTASSLAICGGRVHYLKPDATPTNPVAAVESAAATSVERDSIAQLSSPSALAFAYKFYAGSNFQARSTGYTFSYGGRGCITPGGVSSLSMDVDIPSGAEIQGVRMYYNYNVADGSSPTIFLTQYDGAGSFADLQTFSATDTSAGYHSRYLALTTPYTVNQYNYALVLTVAMPNNPNVEFCGARIFYSYDNGALKGLPGQLAALPAQRSLRPAPFSGPADGVVATDTAPAAVSTSINAPDTPASRTAGTAESMGTAPAPAVADNADVLGLDRAPSADTYYFYRFIAGSTFQPRESSTTTAYKGAGCTYISGGSSILNAAFHLPTGARLLGVRMFYYDNVATDSHMFITSYNGRGGYSEFIVAASSGTPGYDSIYKQATGTYLIDNFNNALNGVWNSGSTTTSDSALCGMRAFYSMTFGPPRILLPAMLK